MCGIVGFTGAHQAAPILLDGLARLEYRGYDSAGLAVRDGTKLAEVVKATGKLRNLAVKNRARPTHTRMSAETAPAPAREKWKRMWSACTTESSRTSPS